MSDEIRLVAMRVAGTFGKGGVKLRVAEGTAREAWDAAVTEEEVAEAATLGGKDARTKLRDAFSPKGETDG